MKQLRIEIIKSKIKLIEESINIVKENLPDKFEEFIKLGLIKDGIYKKIEYSIQEIINICSIINSDLKLGLPSNRDDIFEALVHKDVITKEMGNKIKELKGFRNFLVHRYGKIEDNIAFEDITKGLRDFKKFSDEILKFLDSMKDNNKMQV